MEEIKSPEFTKFIRATLDDVFSSFLFSFIILERFKGSGFGLGSYLFESERKRFGKKGKRFVLYCRLLRVSPVILATRGIGKIIKDTEEKKIFHLGGPYGSISEDEVSVLEELLMTILLGISVFPQLSQKEEQSLLRDLIKEWKQGRNFFSAARRKFWIEKESYLFGKTIKCPLPPKEYGSDEISFRIPLFSGRRIKIKFFEREAVEIPRGEEAVPFISETFLVTNPYFSSGDEVVLFCPCKEDVKAHLFEELVIKGDKKPHLDNLEISEESHCWLLNKLGEKMEIPVLFLLPIPGALKVIDDFVDEAISGEKCGIEGETDLKYLLKCWKKRGKFPGTCKSISTINVAILRSLGIPARRVAGSVVCLLGSTGHSWTEFFCQSLGAWLPFDTGTYGFYPPDIESIEKWYIIEGILKPEKEIRIKVEIL